MPSLRKLGVWMLFLAGPVRIPAERLTLATYNVENYGPVDRLADGGFQRGYPKPESEKRALRTVIEGLGADVLALQEMGPEPYLEELRRDLRAEGFDYPYAALVEAEDKVRHVALLSKLPLTDIRRHADLEFSYLGGRERVKRGLLEASVSAPGGALTLFAVHLKSRLTEREDDPEAAVRRAAEASAVRDCVLKEFPDPSKARFVILGDCNDVAASKALQRLEHRGRLVVAVRIPAEDSRGETWTEFWRREDTYTQIDHILVSPPLRNAAAGGVAHLYDGSGWAEASDHRPVTVMLDFPPPGSGGPTSRSP